MNSDTIANSQRGSVARHHDRRDDEDRERGAEREDEGGIDDRERLDRDEHRRGKRQRVESADCAGPPPRAAK